MPETWMASKLFAEKVLALRCINDKPNFLFPCFVYSDNSFSFERKVNKEYTFRKSWFGVQLVLNSICRVLGDFVVPENRKEERALVIHG